MLTGTIKWFRNGTGPGKGFGFIIPSDETLRELRMDIAQELFIHSENVLRPQPDVAVYLLEGDEVEFNIGHSSRGPRALDLRIIGRAQPATSSTHV